MLSQSPNPLSRQERADRIAGATIYFVPNGEGEEPFVVCSKGGVQVQLRGLSLSGEQTMNLSTPEGEANFSSVMAMYLGRPPASAVANVVLLRDLLSTIRITGACQFAAEDVDRLFDGSSRHPALWVVPVPSEVADALPSWPGDWTRRRALTAQELLDRNQGKRIYLAHEDGALAAGTNIAFVDYGATTVHSAYGYVSQGGFYTTIDFPDGDPFVTNMNEVSWLQVGWSHMARHAFVLPICKNLGVINGDDYGFTEYVRQNVARRVLELRPNETLIIDAEALTTERILGKQNRLFPRPVLSTEVAQGIGLTTTLN